MPWESVDAELPTLYLAEVGSPVIELLSQPHRLEMPVEGRRRPLIYFPDLLLKVEESFLRLLSDMPFGRAMVEWKPNPERPPQPCDLLVEIKNDGDRRRSDPFYVDKLRLAREVYGMFGYGFIQILRSADLDCVDMKTIRQVWLDKGAVLTAVDVGRAVRYLRLHGGVSTRRGLIEALGAGPLAEAMTCALHVRRFVSMDLTKRLNDSTAVRLIRPFQSEVSHDY